jgi:hypothetical protein
MKSFNAAQAAAHEFYKSKPALQICVAFTLLEQIFAAWAFNE